MSESSNFLTKNNPAAEWWRTSVIYQIYPRSFADGNGDGIGDLQGITSRLDSLASLGIDAIWFSPFFKSPQKDAGYDISDYRQIDPIFGTNEDFDVLLTKAKSLGIRIIVDIVPNHTSDQHAWFQAALKSPKGSPERAFYHFKDGKGEHGELPPNNWQSIFGGPAWSRITESDGSLGQWYLHLFDSSQPDLNWENPIIADEFDEILRFWLRKGVDGFRVDVAHGMVKRAGLPDATIYDEN
jgi:alpha-glucosidase